MGSRQRTADKEYLKSFLSLARAVGREPQQDCDHQFQFGCTIVRDGRHNCIGLPNQFRPVEFAATSDDCADHCSYPSAQVIESSTSLSALPLNFAVQTTTLPRAESA